VVPGGTYRSLRYALGHQWLSNIWDPIIGCFDEADSGVWQLLFIKEGTIIISYPPFFLLGIEYTIILL
jgi:hypothetical protein